MFDDVDAHKRQSLPAGEGLRHAIELEKAARGPKVAARLLLATGSERGHLVLRTPKGKMRIADLHLCAAYPYGQWIEDDE